MSERVLRMRKKTNPVVSSDDSGDESSSDAGSSDSVATVVNQNGQKKQTARKQTNQKQTARKQTTQKQKRGRTPARTNAKRQRVQDDSESDTSPQPSTSGVANGQNSSDDSEYNSPESESEDSDYGPLRDKSLPKKKKPSPKKKGRASQKAGQAKNKTQSFVNGVSSIRGSQNQNPNQKQNLNSSRRKSSADVIIDVKLVESLAQKLVYFLLVEDQKKYAIKRNAIYDNVFKDENKSPKLYNAVIKKANFILKKTYGMELMELENQKDRYLIVNILKRELGIHDYVEVSRVKQQQHGLILYLLTIIFMNDNVITEDDLTKSLKQLGIDLTAKKLHPVFGDVKKYITSELVKQMYLNYECISKEPPKYEFTWGIRAKQEFDKKDLLQFACQIMDDTTPESWRMQFKDAEKCADPKVTINGTT